MRCPDRRLSGLARRDTASQVFAQAAENAKSLKLDDLTRSMRSSTFPTVVGYRSFGAKSDVKEPAFTFNEWKDGKSAGQRGAAFQ
jgi:hypothetical protein